jgi:hypothetical protein
MTGSVMPVRGTTIAIHSRYVIVREQNEHEGERIWCAWHDCDKYGVMLHQTIINEAKPGFGVKLARYVFCSAQCKDYFDHSHIPGEYGKLRGRHRHRFLLSFQRAFPGRCKRKSPRVV